MARGSTDHRPRTPRLGVPHPGDLEAAIRVFEEGLALCHATAPMPVMGHRWGPGEAYAHTGRLAEGPRAVRGGAAGRPPHRTVGSSYVIHLRSSARLISSPDALRRPGSTPVSARPGPRAEATWTRGARAVPARCRSLPRPAPRRPAGRGTLPGGAVAGRGAGHAPTPAHCHWPRLPVREDGRPEQARVALATGYRALPRHDMMFCCPRRRPR